MYHCDAKICISESTRQRFSQLRTVYNHIKGNKCGLEIVGVSNLSFNQSPESQGNDTVILAVKVTFESSSSSNIPSTLPESE